MCNYVKEHGFGMASIAAYENTVLGFAANGVWSPDSV